MAPVPATQIEPRAPRRVFTAPAGASAVGTVPSREGSGTVETLYVHPDVKIVAFTAGSDADAASSEAVEPLSWSSHHERTIAVGLFKIYRAPGSVAFLNCGSALKPIMPKGQCWSVTDTNSIFMLQIRRPSYWRIELPDSTEEDLERARTLRAVFNSVLQFEKTPCPFQRSFTVPLPETPPHPAKKRSWAPAPQRLSVDFSKAVEVSALPAKILENKRHTEAKAKLRQRAKDDPPGDCHTISAGGVVALRDAARKQSPSSPSVDPTGSVGRCMPDRSVEHGTGSRISPAVPDTPANTVSLRHPENRGSHSPRRDGSPMPSCPVQRWGEIERSHTSGSRAESASAAVDDGAPQTRMPAAESSGLDAIEGSGSMVGGMKAKLRRRHTGFGTLRSAPSAPQLSLIASPPSKGTQRSLEKESDLSSDEIGRVSPTWSSDSFHSTQSWLSPITPLPPSPPLAQPEDGKDAFPSPPKCVTLPPHQQAEPEVPATPVTPRTGSAHLSASGSSDRTPTLSRPQRCHPKQDDQREASNDTVPDSPARPLSATDSDKAFSTTVERTSIRHRALSPLPSVGNTFKTPDDRATLAHNARASLGALPMLLVAKTCRILLRPPTYLVSLMLKIAARITAGEWRGTAMGYDSTGGHIPVDWDYSDSEWEDTWEGGSGERGRSGSQDDGVVDQMGQGDEEFEDANQSWEVD